MNAWSRIVSWSWLVAAVGLVPAQKLKPGDDAPPISLDSWLGWSGDKKPTLESLKGKVIMLEFWGTWCGPCVRAMPEVQKMHDRYREKGVAVLAISYEEPAVMKPFLDKNAYTMPVGSDPGKVVVAAYGIRSWPSTALIDKEGKVAWIGDPYGAEAAIEKALGLESSPATLLTAWLDTLADSGKERRREALARLADKAPGDFDLQAWARANGGAEQAASQPADAGAPAPAAAAAPKAGAPDAGEHLRKLTACWSKDQTQRKSLLRVLAADAPTSFDLGAFVREAYAKAFPLDAKELSGLLSQQKYGDALEALVARRPAPAVVAVAAGDKKLADYCKKKVDETRSFAKKALMVQRWWFSGVQPKDQERFSRDLAISGVAMSPDQKQITGVLLGGAQVSKAMAEGYIQSHFTQALLMDALGSGKQPPIAELDKLATKERQRTLKTLEETYGVAEKQPK